MKKNGFTLIELLVIISIIAFVSTSAIYMVNNVRKKARDARRMADMKQIQNALDLYFDKYGVFPTAVYDTNCWNWDVGNKNRELLKGVNGDGITDVLNEFMKNPPVDPTNLNKCPGGLCSSQDNCGGYRYYKYPAGDSGCNPSKGEFYVLGITDLETTNWPSPESPGFKCAGNWNSGPRDWQNEFDWVVGVYSK